MRGTHPAHSCANAERYTTPRLAAVFFIAWQEEFTPGWHGYPGSDGSWSGYNETYRCDWDCYIGMFHTLSRQLHTLYDAGPSAAGERPLLIGPCEGMVGWRTPDHAVFYNFTTQARCPPLRLATPQSARIRA